MQNFSTTRWSLASQHCASADGPNSAPCLQKTTPVAPPGQRWAGSGQRAVAVDRVPARKTCRPCARVLEAFHKARQTGTDWAQLYDVVTKGSANSGVLQRIVGGNLEGDYKRYTFTVANAAKDMRYIVELDEVTAVSFLGIVLDRLISTAFAYGAAVARAFLSVAGVNRCNATFLFCAVGRASGIRSQYGGARNFREGSRRRTRQPADLGAAAARASPPAAALNR